MVVLCFVTLSENCGDNDDSNLLDSLVSGGKVVLSSWPVASLGIIQAWFSFVQTSLFLVDSLTNSKPKQLGTI